MLTKYCHHAALRYVNCEVLSKGRIEVVHHRRVNQLYVHMIERNLFLSYALPAIRM